MQTPAYILLLTLLMQCFAAPLHAGAKEERLSAEKDLSASYALQIERMFAEYKQHVPVTMDTRETVDMMYDATNKYIKISDSYLSTTLQAQLNNNSKYNNNKITK